MSHSNGIELNGEDVYVTCGCCGSKDVMFVACPEHEWAVAFTCFACQQSQPVGRGACKECGWTGAER